MKLARSEIARSGGENPLRLFDQGIRAEATRRKYTATVRRILCDVLEDVLEGDFEQRASQFVQRGRDDPDWMLDLLVSLSWKIRGRTELPRGHAEYLNPTSVKSYFVPLRKLLEMNNVTVNWRRVYTTLPEKDNMADDTGWTRENVAAMLAHARDPMDRAIVMLLASSGVRLGGLDLNWGDITPIYRSGGRLTADPDGGNEVACAALSVYAGSPEGYTAFITPEAYAAVREYGRMWASMMHGRPGPGDPLLLSTKLLPRRATESSIVKRVRRMADRAGLRDPGSKKGNRFGTQLMHGFRKFFNKTCKEALSGDSLASLIRTEYMMGHRGLVALDQSYFKTSMLEMAAEYVKVVPDLTIDDAERLKRSNRTMAENIQRMEDEKDAEIERLRGQVRDMKGEKDAEIERLRGQVRDMKGEKDAEIERLRGQVRDMEEKMSKIIERGDSRAYGMPNATLASKTGGVPGDALESFAKMVGDLVAAQNDEIRKMRAEYDAKMDRLVRTIERVANGGNPGRGTPARTKEEGADDGSGDADDLDMRGPGPHRRDPS